MNKTLVTKLDNIFSEFIRLRDSDGNGYVRCISCGKVSFWRDVDNGHFVNRKHLSTRWNEKNCNGQCRSCNRFDEGNVVGYSMGLINKYGAGIMDELDVIKHQTSKLSNFEGELFIKHYKEKVRELKLQKGL